MQGTKAQQDPLEGMKGSFTLGWEGVCSSLSLLP